MASRGKYIFSIKMQYETFSYLRSIDMAVEKENKLTYHSTKKREKEGRDHKPFTAWNDIVKGIQCMLD